MRKTIHILAVLAFSAVLFWSSWQEIVENNPFSYYQSHPSHLLVVIAVGVAGVLLTPSLQRIPAVFYYRVGTALAFVAAFLFSVFSIDLWCIRIEVAVPIQGYVPEDLLPDLSATATILTLVACCMWLGTLFLLRKCRVIGNGTAESLETPLSRTS